MTWNDLIKMLEDMGIDQEIINNLIGELVPSNPLKKLADEGLKMNDDLQSLYDDGIGPSSYLSEIYRRGIPVNIPNIPGREHGGPVSAGRAYWVGEGGSELFVPHTSGSIIPNWLLEATEGFQSISDSIDDYRMEAMGKSKRDIGLENLMRWRRREGLFTPGNIDEGWGSVLDFTGMSADQLGEYAKELKGYYQSLFEDIKAKYELEKNNLEELVSLEKKRIEELRSLIDSISDKIRSLRYSSYSLALPKERAEEAAIDYAALFQAARGGDPDAVRKYLSFIDTYLSQAQAAYKSSAKYLDIWDMINVDLKSLGLTLKDQLTVAEQTLRNIESELKALRNTFEIELRALRAAIYNTHALLPGREHGGSVTAGEAYWVGEKVIVQPSIGK